MCYPTQMSSIFVIFFQTWALYRLAQIKSLENQKTRLVMLNNKRYFYLFFRPQLNWTCVTDRQQQQTSKKGFQSCRETDISYFCLGMLERIQKIVISEPKRWT